MSAVKTVAWDCPDHGINDMACCDVCKKPLDPLVRRADVVAWLRERATAARADILEQPCWILGEAADALEAEE